MKLSVLSFAAIAALAMPVLAQDAAPADPQAAGAEMTVTDPQQFVDMAAVSNMFEIQSSEIAVQVASAQEVKDFAQQMVDDHTAAGEAMKAAASEEGITPPTELDQEHQDKITQLQDAAGESFDQLYIDMQVEAHEKAVALFESYSQNGPDGALKDFAAETLPTLQQHHEMVMGLSGQ